MLYPLGMSVYLSDNYKIPEHVSYSALTTYIDCGYLYYLGRLLEISEQPAVWSAGGSAFHKATEEWDKQHVE